MLRRILQVAAFAVLALAFTGRVQAQGQAQSQGQAESQSGPHKIIFDTDFGMVPQDDCYALMLALHSPELEILGITTVAGNFSLEQGTADVLRLLEIAEREDIPVHPGANMPLMHTPSPYAMDRHGSWWSDEPASVPPGGFAKKEAEDLGAVEFIIDTVEARPGEVTIVAIGPLTNVAMALRHAPGLAQKVRQLVIMGGAVAALPDGEGNATPGAEFNFWVDPEAAKIVLRSGIPIMLSPLNVSRKSDMTREWYEKLVAVDTPFTRLIREFEGPLYVEDPERVVLMYDQIAVASLFDPSLVTSSEYYVDVDANPGLSYGTSHGGTELWPGAEGAQKMAVQHELDWERFIQTFIDRVAQPIPSKPISNQPGPQQ